MYNNSGGNLQNIAVSARDNYNRIESNSYGLVIISHNSS